MAPQHKVAGLPKVSLSLQTNIVRKDTEKKIVLDSNHCNLSSSNKNQKQTQEFFFFFTKPLYALQSNPSSKDWIVRAHK